MKCYTWGHSFPSGRSLYYIIKCPEVVILQALGHNIITGRHSTGGVEMFIILGDVFAPLLPVQVKSHDAVKPSYCFPLRICYSLEVFVSLFFVRMVLLPVVFVLVKQNHVRTGFQFLSISYTCKIGDKFPYEMFNYHLCVLDHVLYFNAFKLSNLYISYYDT